MRHVLSNLNQTWTKKRENGGWGELAESWQDEADILSDAALFTEAGLTYFAHSAQTRRVTEPLDRCLSAYGGGGEAFVVWGASGAGKTSVIAEAADRTARSMHSVSNEAVIVRFLGTTPASWHTKTGKLEGFVKVTHFYHKYISSKYFSCAAWSSGGDPLASRSTHQRLSGKTRIACAHVPLFDRQTLMLLLSS
jgi:hypothetical protein